MTPSSKITEFYKNQTIFLTGGSGFLGKVLIEKLLRECDDLEKIYVLLRPKKGKTSQERLNDLFNFACFNNLKTIKPESLKKVKLIKGDCLEEFLGLSQEDINILINETTCVIHAAANVKFDQSLKEAAGNVRATRDILELAKQMKKLQIFVYVSTAYSNCIYSHIKEEFYPPIMKADKLLTLVDSLDEELHEIVTPYLLKDCPNTYIFSKSISEDLVKAASGFLPITVVRPGIVISALREPMPGWIDNFYGPVGIVFAAALGVLRSMHAKLDANSYIVPVDVIANCVLAAAWKNTNCSKLVIYNHVGNKNNQLTWGKYMEIVEPACWKAASEKVIWYYSFKLRENKILHKLTIFFYHTVLSYVVDFVLFCLRKPTLAVKNYQRLNKTLDLISYFSTRHWEFDTHNLLELWNSMSEEDQRIYYFNMEYIEWDVYALFSTLCSRKYLIKDTDGFAKGNRKIKILRVAHYSVIAIFWFLVYKFVMFIIKFFV